MSYAKKRVEESVRREKEEALRILSAAQLLLDDLERIDSNLFECSSRALAVGLRDVEHKLDETIHKLRSAEEMLRLITHGLIRK